MRCLAISTAMMAVAAGQLPSATAADKTAFPGEDWDAATPASQGLDPDKLHAAIEYLEKQTGTEGVKRLVIVRHGRMIFGGSEADRQQPVASVTKAFTSTAHGLLIEDGKCALDTLAKDFNPALAQHYPTVTLRHFATMTSGFDGVGGTYDCDADKKRCDANALVDPLPPVFAPGTKYMYWDEATQHYGYALTQIAGESLDEYLRRRILDPIGMTRFAWRPDATGKVLNWTGGIEVSASDLARFGHLFLNRGNWNGKQLVSASWVREATKVQVPPSLPSGQPTSDRQGSGIYGCHWWPNGIKPDGQRHWPDGPRGTFARSGFKNNILFVIPEWDMVIVRLSPDRQERKIEADEYNLFLKKLGAAIQAPIRSVEPPRRAGKAALHSEPAASAAAGPLRPHPTNPRYFTDGSGKIIYLTGSHTWDIFQRWLEGNKGMGRPADFAAYLDVLRNHNHNFIRFWVADTAWSPVTKAAIEPQPYVRTGPGKAADGGLKFDLNRLNQAYFDELRTRVISARDRGMYVGVMLFNGWGVGVYQNPPHNVTWDYHPFNKANNINGIDGDPNRDRRGLEYHSLEIAAITKLQETYVRNVVDAVNDLDNVLYEISNESGPTSVKWQHHMIRSIKNYEATKPKQHPVIMSGGWGMKNADLFASPADAVAPGNEPPKEKYATDPPPATGTKVVLIDSDHNGSDRTDPQFAWRSILRGHNPIVMDWWNGDQWNPIRRALGHTRRYADKMNLAEMTPRNDLASSLYCLAAPGREYLVYLPDGGAVTVDFTAVTGTLTVEWMHPVEGKITPGEATAGGGKRQFKAPFAGDAVLYLTTKE